MPNAEIERVALITDFGTAGFYTGQMQLSLAAQVPMVPVVDLAADLPPFRPDLSGYLLPALVRDMPIGTLYLCVVDPEVGGERAALVVEADGNWFVGPDNGLLAIVARRASDLRILRIDWRPERYSDTFHGRDLFVPIAVRLLRGDPPHAMETLAQQALVGADWPDDLLRVVYVDRFGNLITGMRAMHLDHAAILKAGGYDLRHARTFCEVRLGAAFWFEDAFGLVELAVNQGRADAVLGLGVGGAVDVLG